MHFMWKMQDHSYQRKYELWLHTANIRLLHMDVMSLYLNVLIRYSDKLNFWNCRMFCMVLLLNGVLPSDYVLQIHEAICFIKFI